ncbi:uncharacterized protein RHOBADRAFT_46358 [Rhodotorula graminis WP1]|uniref:Uncharacterized protein n=1 Tax=Rhodotorula graminis (strain WP1) TaxID=578459 RepID=A0A0P9GIF9_RHOGW|nr:uncharacterized protein RHOBADRAFT_46358 [Rhodotorula graminis WP1]KPV72763.1 hypothetical protein RHOBADRAFT_46358 [Rhodotorula graminis WP1]
MDAYVRAIGAIKATGDAYVDWRTRRGSEDGASSDRDVWQRSLNEFIPRDWYLCWPSHEQAGFLHDLSEVRKVFERNLADKGASLPGAGIQSLMPTLARMLHSFSRFEHYVRCISRIVGEWFAEDILTYVDEQHYATQPGFKKSEVCGELFNVYPGVLRRELGVDEVRNYLKGAKPIRENKLWAVFQMVSVCKTKWLEEGRTE